MKNLSSSKTPKQTDNTVVPIASSKPIEQAHDAAAGKRLRQVETLLSVSHRVAALESLEEILTTLVDMTTAELDADRGTLFLNDPLTEELYSRVAQGNFQREIRILNNTGVAGAVFQSGVGELIHDAYADERFNSTVDSASGYHTDTIVCAPVRTVRGDVIGVIQMLNKNDGYFDESDLELLEAMTTQATLALQSTQYVEKMKKTREQEMHFLDLVSDVTSELELGTLLQRVMSEATRMLSADRSTLFINDEKTNELFSRVAMGDTIGEIRLPNHLGIAGTVFSTGETVNIPYAYADLRFNPAFDKKTGYFTRSILCVPVANKTGKVIGVTQALNKRGGPFTDEDEQRLKAFTAQVSIALENAKLFDDVQNMKNYNESMLESMSNTVITMDEDGKIVTCNRSGLVFFAAAEDEIIGQMADEFFSGPNEWVIDKIKQVDEEQEAAEMMDAAIDVDGETMSINGTFLPLLSTEGDRLGSMIMVEDISSEKRMKSTMSRYMDPGIADQLMGDGKSEDFLGGQSSEITVLFSDVRSFTTLTESLGAQGTVQMLNEYFTIMVDIITREGGMLDKFIGDAIMAGFGIPISHDDNEDRAVRAAIAMISELWEWNVEREARGDLPLDHGVGLNTGLVVSGNIGSPKRMDYTMIGDGVNLAARLESACKQYHARVLISEFTRAKLKGTYRIRDVDQVVVKGKTEPVGVFEVLDYHNETTFPNLMDTVGYFNEGVAKYRIGEWDASIKKFNEALVANPNDALAQTYIDRNELLKSDPPKDWDGIWVMTSK
ncbi:MAG: GAF domain-containing protein [Rhodospirillales bacterium]|nr:GAF domain-containing protein [Rhodospirillales bacterium]MBT4041554.1 GAF domain-containing protein [Rhodospirillales bacterium]MBT4627685.1 GAF domain-containing protein [Rhodospirillales bacterium]MBT5351618.1 GAF domain-containing protein [Rhodospirillales bacterium]MBT5519267.1 GAF domain-containing protein [Rhodospirillales bacterium]